MVDVLLGDDELDKTRYVFVLLCWFVLGTVNRTYAQVQRVYVSVSFHSSVGYRHMTSPRLHWHDT